MTTPGNAMDARPDDRDPGCVARWPECEDGTYDPRCCRFPKSCSCDPVPAVAASPHAEGEPRCAYKFNNGLYCRKDERAHRSTAYPVIRHDFVRPPASPETPVPGAGEHTAAPPPAPSGSTESGECVYLCTCTCHGSAAATVASAKRAVPGPGGGLDREGVRVAVESGLGCSVGQRDDDDIPYCSEHDDEMPCTEVRNVLAAFAPLLAGGGRDG